MKTIRQMARAGLTSLLGRNGYVMVPAPLAYDWQIQPDHDEAPSYRSSPAPPGAVEYLRPDNPRLQELQARYDRFDRRATEPLTWNPGYVRAEDLLYFRGDNAYVWQLRGRNMQELGYLVTLLYANSIDTLNLLSKLKEDGLFGAYAFELNNTLVSRDLLDSIIEIYFLERHLKISSKPNLSVLDIGAGYGRLAHRLLTAFPDIRSYSCTDAVAPSTFLSEYYLGFRGLKDRAKVIPLDEIESQLKARPIDLAINIHSFSECTLAAIDWWVSLLQQQAVRNVMIVPNPNDHGGELRTNDGKDFQHVFERHGYVLRVKAPKYADPTVQQHAIAPTHHYLFELSG
jgi:hypothetical protein